MKKIEAVINPHDLDEARDALVQVGVDGISVSEIRTWDQCARSNFYRGAEYAASFVPQIKIEVVIDDARVASCAAAISRCGRGDAIVVFSVEDTIQIRTGLHTARAA